MILKILPYVMVFLGALALTLVLTPIIRELNRRLGMVDKPDPRRINKMPIPRGGGLAVVLGLFVSYGTFLALTGRPGIYGLPQPTFLKMSLKADLVHLRIFKMPTQATKQDLHTPTLIKLSSNVMTTTNLKHKVLMLMQFV